MRKKVKMADIAEELNVSVVTVSKALSGQKGVSEEVRDKIKNLAEELGYKQVGSLKYDKEYESYNIGIVVPDRYFGKYVSFYWQLYQEVTKESAERQCFTMLEVISMEDEMNSKLPMLMKEKKADGIIFMGQPREGYIKKLCDEGAMPLVCLDFYDKTTNCDSVISDGFYGTYMLTNLLFNAGHQDIGYVGTLQYTNSITDRYFGYCKSMMEHGETVKQNRVMNDRDWETGDVNNYNFEFPEDMPTAFVCNSDLTACALIKSLKVKGFRIPEDISVVGFDNYLYPGLCDVGITTFDVNVKEMASKSIDRLIDKISKESQKTGIMMVEGSIVYKESVAKKD